MSRESSLGIQHRLPVNEREMIPGKDKRFSFLHNTQTGSADYAAS
jgi:hypothetical protein